MSANWHLQWDMDGMQWEVLSAAMFEEYPVKGISMRTDTWLGCLMFAYTYLVAYSQPCKTLTIYTKDDKYVIDRETIIDVLKKEYPEEFI
jgi:hypothetical protein